MDDFYNIGYRCRNCGKRGKLDIPRGKKLEDVECPVCNCKTLELDSNVAKPFSVNDSIFTTDSSTHEINEDT